MNTNRRVITRSAIAIFTTAACALGAVLAFRQAGCAEPPLSRGLPCGLASLSIVLGIACSSWYWGPWVRRRDKSAVDNHDQFQQKLAPGAGEAAPAMVNVKDMMSRRTAMRRESLAFLVIVVMVSAVPFMPGGFDRWLPGRAFIDAIPAIGVCGRDIRGCNWVACPHCSWKIWSSMRSMWAGS